ncbi:PREDICTED: zinc finger CCCH domain-containing protein 3 [Galeopterus variegatus]|uniref:Zinc finger CCCH domain-containing protein 3 n=1 Tax=Galeopterus variegatus TaxID=482537 RepID=A0ABM0RL05_GALVR|nr:PREDICTED: zinc finger CCCH domain-containing protein 3 [Galeopterus variegatus]
MHRNLYSRSVAPERRGVVSPGLLFQNAFRASWGSGVEVARAAAPVGLGLRQRCQAAAIHSQEEQRGGRGTRGQRSTLRYSARAAAASVGRWRGRGIAGIIPRSRFQFFRNNSKQRCWARCAPEVAERAGSESAGEERETREGPAAHRTAARPHSQAGEDQDVRRSPAGTLGTPRGSPATGFVPPSSEVGPPRARCGRALGAQSRARGACPGRQRRPQRRAEPGQGTAEASLIDDYKNLHSSAPAPGASAASRWQPSTYHNGRAFSARYPRPSRRGFSSHRGPAWRKKYSLVNRPPGSSDPPGDHAVQPPLGARGSQSPDSQQFVLERQVQLNPDQNMVIKIKPPSKSGSISTSGAQRCSLQEYEDTPWNDQRPQEGEGEPPGGQLQPLRTGRTRGSCSAEDSLLVCQKEAGKPRVVKSVGSVGSSPLEPRRTVSESAVAAKAHFPSSTLSPLTVVAVGQKVGSHSVASCAARLLEDGRVNATHPDQPGTSSSAVGPARPASGPRQAQETSMLVSCQTNRFQKNNYKWVATSAKSPRAARRSLNPRAATENVCKALFDATGKMERPQLRADPEAKPRKQAPSSKPGPSPSKYKWKASSPSASSSSSFRWQSEAGSKDHASQLSPVPSRSPPGDTPAVGPSGLKPLFGETPLSAYKVKSRTKIVRRRGSTSLPGDKKSSPSPVTTAKSHLSLRRRQAIRGKSSPVLKKTPNKGLMQVTRHRLCRLPPSRVHLPTKEGLEQSGVQAATAGVVPPQAHSEETGSEECGIWRSGPWARHRGELRGCHRPWERPLGSHAGQDVEPAMVELGKPEVGRQAPSPARGGAMGHSELHQDGLLGPGGAEKHRGKVAGSGDWQVTLHEGLVGGSKLLPSPLPSVPTQEAEPQDHTTTAMRSTAHPFALKPIPGCSPALLLV